jgi:hypothetical protein
LGGYAAHRTGQSTLNQTIEKLKRKTKASISTEKHKVSS